MFVEHAIIFIACCRILVSSYLTFMYISIFWIHLDGDRRSSYTLKKAVGHEWIKLSPRSTVDNHSIQSIAYCSGAMYDDTEGQSAITAYIWVSNRIPKNLHPPPTVAEFIKFAIDLL